jgi:hypothetical protein
MSFFDILRPQGRAFYNIGKTDPRTSEGCVPWQHDIRVTDAATGLPSRAVLVGSLRKSARSTPVIGEYYDYRELVELRER